MTKTYIGLILMLIAGILAGCGAALSAEISQEGATQVGQGTAVEAGSVGAILDESYQGALPAGNQLAMGTLLLEGTGYAVTAEQARTLLPLWQAIQGGSLQSEAETNAVLKQIQGAMTVEQLSDIASMQLTFEGMTAWMQEQGLNLHLAAGTGGGPGQLGDMSDEERAAMRATAQAGGGFGGRGDMSEEDRAARRSTAEASGMIFGNTTGDPLAGRPGVAGGGQLTLLAQPLVELLSGRVGQ